MLQIKANEKSQIAGSILGKKWAEEEYKLDLVNSIIQATGLP